MRDVKGDGLVLFAENLRISPGAESKAGNVAFPDAARYRAELAYPARDALNKHLRVPRLGRKASVAWADDRDMVDLLTEVRWHPGSSPEDVADVLRVTRGELPVPHGYYWGVGAPIIRVNQKASSPFLTLAHELGHLVDNVLLGLVSPGRSGAWSSHDCPRLEAWRKAVYSSWAVGPGGIGAPNGALTEYLMRPQELFARSFAQYVAVTMDAEGGMLRLELDEVLGAADERGRQWLEPDFYGIRTAFDELFGSLGWSI